MAGFKPLPALGSYPEWLPPHIQQNCPPSADCSRHKVGQMTDQAPIPSGFFNQSSTKCIQLQLVYHPFSLTLKHNNLLALFL